MYDYEVVASRRKRFSVRRTGKLTEDLILQIREEYDELIKFWRASETGLNFRGVPIDPRKYVDISIISIVDNLVISLRDNSIIFSPNIDSIPISAVVLLDEEKNYQGHTFVSTLPFDSRICIFYSQYKHDLFLLKKDNNLLFLLEGVRQFALKEDCKEIRFLYNYNTTEDLIFPEIIKKDFGYYHSQLKNTYLYYRKYFNMSIINIDHAYYKSLEVIRDKTIPDLSIKYSPNIKVNFYESEKIGVSTLSGFFNPEYAIPNNSRISSSFKNLIQWSVGTKDGNWDGVYVETFKGVETFRIDYKNNRRVNNFFGTGENVVESKYCNGYLNGFSYVFDLNKSLIGVAAYEYGFMVDNLSQSTETEEFRRVDEFILDF